MFVWCCLTWRYKQTNNISVISWRSVLLVEETEGPGENHRPIASHWQTLSHNVVHLALIAIRIHNINGDRHWLHSSFFMKYYILIDWVWGNSWSVVPETLTIDRGEAEVNSQGRGDNKLAIPEYTAYKYFIIPNNIRLIVEWSPQNDKDQ